MIDRTEGTDRLVKHRQKFAVLAVATALACGTAVGTAAPSSAAQPAGPGATPSSCLSASQWDDLKITGFRSYARLTNNCSTAYRFKFVWKHDFDGGCNTIKAGWMRTEWRQGRDPYVSEFRPC